jgi:platelet-activating factor acetylhydrolase isoform II
MLLWSLLGWNVLKAQSNAPANILPPPTGSLAVARVTCAWVDSSRAPFIEEKAAGQRELIVDVWYPTSNPAGRPSAPYLPGLPLLRHALGDSALGAEFAPAYAAMEVGSLRTHAAEGSPAACPARGCPVLIFSHGGGVDRSFYTAQYEDLASHGYVVAVIAHTHDTHLVIFPDGRAIGASAPPRDTTPPDPSLPRWRQALQRDARSQGYVRRVIALEAADIRFVIDELFRYAKDSARHAPFARRLDLSRLGALGHSAGGEAAALACQLDRRLRACENQDGAMNNFPFARDPTGRAMEQPFLYFTRGYHPPITSDGELAALQMTKAEYDSLRTDIVAGPTRLLADIRGGAYRITLTTPGVTHMSFSDEPLIAAAGDSGKMSNALLALRIINTYSRAFFDKTLRGQAGTALDHPAERGSAFVTIERFGPRPVRRPGAKR